MKTTKVKVRKYDPKARAHMPADKAENLVELPLGLELVELAAESYGSGRGVTPNSVDYRPLMRFLREKGVRAIDLIAASKPEFRNVRRLLVRAILADDQTRPLFAPMMQEQIAAGFQQVAADWQAFVPTVPIDASSIEDFVFQDPNTSEDFVLRLLGQGARIPVARITVSGKTVYLTTKGRGIEWTDKAQRAPVSLAERWMMNVGIRLGRFYFEHAGIILRDGYYDDLSDAPQVVQTADTTKFQLGDILTAISAVEDDNGFPVTDLMMSPASLIGLLTQTISGGGGFVFPEGLEERLGVERVHKNKAIGNDVIIPFNADMALVRYEGKAFGTEDERTVSQQISATYATVEDEIVVNEKKARVVLKKNW